MAKKVPKHGIKNIRIEPADDGGFMTEICHYPKPQPEEKIKSDDGKVTIVRPGFSDYDSNITKHVHANGKDLGEFIMGLFPGAVARSKKGTSSSQAGDGSRIDTYDSSEGGDEEEVE